MMDVLLVDDNLANLWIIKMLLEKRGFVVATAENGQEALNLLQQKNFDLLITDYQMPIINGIELLRKIKNLQTRKLLISCAYDNDLALAANKLGASCLPKDSEKILEYIKPLELVFAVH